MGNQENIPGECVSGFIPATQHTAEHEYKAQVSAHKEPGLTRRWRTECDIFVQRGLKVARKAMEHWVTTHGETETLIPVVVHVWNRIRDKMKRQKTKKTTHSHSPGVSPTCRWVFEGEAGFGFGQLVEVVQTHHIRRLKVALGVLVSFPAAAHFVVELGGGQRGQVGRVGTRDAHAVLCTKMKSRERESETRWKRSIDSN